MTSHLIGKGFTKGLCVIITFLFLLSCNNTSKLVYKKKEEGNRIRFFCDQFAKTQKMS